MRGNWLTGVWAQLDRQQTKIGFSKLFVFINAIDNIFHGAFSVMYDNVSSHTVNN